MATPRKISIKKWYLYFTYEYRGTLESFSLLITVKTITKRNRIRNTAIHLKQNFDKLDVHISLISLHVHRLWINLLIEFGSKTNKRKTTINKFIRYLCFIVVVFIHVHICHHRLKMRSFSWKKTKFRSIDLNCWRSKQPLRLQRYIKAFNTSS